MNAIINGLPFHSRTHDIDSNSFEVVVTKLMTETIMSTLAK